MRTGANPAAFTNSLAFQVVDPDAVPGVALNSHVQFEVDFLSNGIETPRLDELTLLFQGGATDMIFPLFEGASVYFQDRFWYSQIRQDQATPDVVWKLFGAGWSDHDDYAMSFFAIHGPFLMSGSALEGIVYRNITDEDGVRLKQKDGRRIRPTLRTTDYRGSGQERDSTVLEALIVARNENILITDRDLVVNGGFEEWAGINPSGWTPSVFGGVRHVSGETDMRNVGAGKYSAKIQILSTMGSVPTDWTIRQSVRLKNDEAYTLRFMAKSEGAAPNILKLQAVMPSGTDQYLTDGGSWSTTVTDLAASFAFTDSMEEFALNFVTPSDIENATEVRLIFGFASGSAAALFWLDEVSILPAETNFGFLITPYLDRLPKLPPQKMLLRQGNLAVVKERIPIDEALVRNVGLEITMDEAQASGKIMGIWVRMAREALKDA
jgi:hypothetical protein